MTLSPLAGLALAAFISTSSVLTDTPAPNPVRNSLVYSEAHPSFLKETTHLTLTLGIFVTNEHIFAGVELEV